MREDEPMDRAIIGYGRLPLSRRDLLKRGVAVAAGVPTLASLAAACGGSSSSSSASAAASTPKGQAVLLNFTGWMGKNTPAEFAQTYLGASL